MIVLSKEAFLKQKTSDTLVIFGSGSSINKISDAQWSAIASYDSIGFNWFCHHWFGPTFFVIREQANIRSRNVATETRKHLFEDLERKSYAKTCLIVHNISHSRHVYSYAARHRKFCQNGIIVKDLKGKLKFKRLRGDIFSKGVCHGSCTLTNVIHIGLYLKYKRLIFAGIDLRDSSYFWLPKNKTRKNIRRKGLSSESKHPIFRKTLKLVKTVKKHFSVEMTTINRKSGLVSVIPFKGLS